MIRLFISYRREKNGIAAGRLFQILTGRAEVSMDVETLPPGTRFQEALERQVASCNAVLALIGPGWLQLAELSTGEKDYVRVEIAFALKQNIPVVPLLIDGAVLPPATHLPPDLQTLPDVEPFELKNFRAPELAGLILQRIDRDLAANTTNKEQKRTLKPSPAPPPEYRDRPPPSSPASHRSEATRVDPTPVPPDLRYKTEEALKNQRDHESKAQAERLKFEKEAEAKRRADHLTGQRLLEEKRQAASQQKQAQTLASRDLERTSRAAREEEQQRAAEERRILREAESKRKEEEDARQRRESEVQKRLAEQARLLQIAQAKAAADERTRLEKIQQDRRIAEETRKRRQEAEIKQRAQQQQKLQREMDARKRAGEDTLLNRPSKR